MLVWNLLVWYHFTPLIGHYSSRFSLHSMSSSKWERLQNIGVFFTVFLSFALKVLPALRKQNKSMFKIFGDLELFMFPISAFNIFDPCGRYGRWYGVTDRSNGATPCHYKFDRDGHRDLKKVETFPWISHVKLVNSPF